MTFTHTWRLRRYLGERFGQPCRVLAFSRKAPAIVSTPMIVNPPAPKNMGSILVAFADGHRAVTSRYAVRRIAG